MAGILDAPGGIFGLGRVQPTREQGLGQLREMMNLTPVGDITAMGLGLLNRNPLEFGLGAASLLLPGTIKPKGDIAKAVADKLRLTKMREPHAIRVYEYPRGQKNAYMMSDSHAIGAHGNVTAFGGTPEEALENYKKEWLKRLKEMGIESIDELPPDTVNFTR